MRIAKGFYTGVKFSRRNKEIVDLLDIGGIYGLLRKNGDIDAP